MRLYHYTSIDAFAKIWVSKKLRFSESKNTNDLFERSKTWEFVCGILPTGIDVDIMDALNHFGKSFSDLLAQYKQISFTLDYNKFEGCKSSMMWGQYAHNDNGVCIEFDSEKLNYVRNIYASKIKYTYNVPKIRFDKENAFVDNSYLKSFIKRNRKALFFTKHKQWEHENEFRLISNDEDYLPIDGAIKRVYVFNSSSINTRVVEHIVNGEVPIYYLYISHTNGKRDIGFDSLGNYRQIEKRLKEEPDYYTNQDKVRTRLNDILNRVVKDIK